MSFATYRVVLASLTTAAIATAGCTTAAQPPPAPAPVPIPVVQRAEPPTPPPNEWNVFPDPMSGDVDIYHNGESVGSITGDEKEDPPIPHPRKDQDAAPAP